MMGYGWAVVLQGAVQSKTQYDHNKMCHHHHHHVEDRLIQKKNLSKKTLTLSYEGDLQQQIQINS